MVYVVSDLIAYVEDCHAVATGESVFDDSNICTTNFSSFWFVSGEWRNQRKTFLSEPEFWKQFHGLFQASERGVKVCKSLFPLGTATGLPRWLSCDGLWRRCQGGPDSGHFWANTLLPNVWHLWLVSIPDGYWMQSRASLTIGFAAMGQLPSCTYLW